MPVRVIGCNSNGRPCNGFFLEMVLEELDEGGEFFAAEGRVYLKPNTTTTHWQDCIYAATTERLVSLKGTQDKPVQNMQFHGMTYTQSIPTFLGGKTAKRSMAPGSGDWSIFQSAAFYMEGTQHVTIANCTFKDIGGNAVFMMGYSRWNKVLDSEFVWLGDSAVALVGRLKGGSIVSADGTNGDFPSDNIVSGNHIHENGLLTKQSSPYFQTIACHNNITNNLMYNGPRAGINLNDGFGGGDLIEGNIIFNMVRETNDHGQYTTHDNIAPFCQKWCQNCDLRCVLRRSTKGAGCETRLEARIKWGNPPPPFHL